MVQIKVTNEMILKILTGIKLVSCFLLLFELIISTKGIILEYHLFALPFAVFIIVSIISGMLLWKNIIPSKKELTSKLSVLFGTAFLLIALFYLTGLTFQLFALNEIVNLTNPDADISSAFSDALIMIGMHVLGAIIVAILLFLYWKEKEFANYLVILVSLLLAYSLGSYPHVLFSWVVFQLAMWGPMILKLLKIRKF